MFAFFFSSRRRHTRCSRDWSSDVCSSDLMGESGHVPFAVTEDMVIAALLHDAVEDEGGLPRLQDIEAKFGKDVAKIEGRCTDRSEEHTSELQSRLHLVCRLLLEKKKINEQQLRYNS